MIVLSFPIAFETNTRSPSSAAADAIKMVGQEHNNQSVPCSTVPDDGKQRAKLKLPLKTLRNLDRLKRSRLRGLNTTVLEVSSPPWRLIPPSIG